MIKTDGTIIEFLAGSHSYEGVWFGQKHQAREGSYWWRKILREYIATQPQKVEVGEVVEFAEWILKEAVLPRDTNWFDAGNHYTSEELYKLFQDTKSI